MYDVESYFAAIVIKVLLSSCLLEMRLRSLSLSCCSKILIIIVTTANDDASRKP
jgi:hypothetical protein